MTFKVTHFDEHGHRHCLRLTARNNKAAMDWAEQLFGVARAMSCIALRGL
ncbi:MAG: hypothetical protein WAW73_07320 [Rhodoferax sp.]